LALLLQLPITSGLLLLLLLLLQLQLLQALAQRSCHQWQGKVVWGCMDGRRLDARQQLHTRQATQQIGTINSRHSR
jgi:hypothetical protein